MTDAIVKKDEVKPLERPQVEGSMKLNDFMSRSLPHDGLVYPYDGDNRHQAFLLVGRASHGGFRYDAQNRYYVEDVAALEYRLRHDNGWSMGHILAMPHGVDYGTYVSQYLSPLISGPWFNEPVFYDNISRWIEALPVPSKTVPGAVAYFQDVNKRARDIQTPIKPGKFLKKFFSDLLTEPEIQALALKWANHYAVRTAVVTQDADEIERAYKGKYNGSCMHFPLGTHDSVVHPARVYAGPDLGTAYIGELDSIDARCMVWPSKKIFYPKWYGDGPRLQAALEAVGYRAAQAHEFMGARIQRIEQPDSNTFVLPYLDTTEHCRDDGEFLVLDDEGAVYARNTNGLSGEGIRCDDCDDTVSEDNRVFTAGGGTICSCCRDNDYFYCHETSEYHPNHARAAVYADCDDSYSEQGMAALVSRGRWFLCDAQQVHFPHRYYSEASTIEGPSVELGYAEANGFFCEYGDEWCLDMTQKVELSDGRVVAKTSFHAMSALRDWVAEEGQTIVGTDEHPDQTEMDLAA